MLFRKPVDNKNVVALTCGHWFEGARELYYLTDNVMCPQCSKKEEVR